MRVMVMSPPLRGSGGEGGKQRVLPRLPALSRLVRVRLAVVVAVTAT